MLWALRYKADTEAVLERVLAREQEDAALLGRCVAELKRKGLEFDLLKEVDALRRAKALRVEAKAGADGPRRWPARDLPVFALFGAACGVLVLTRISVSRVSENRRKIGTAIWHDTIWNVVGNVQNKLPSAGVGIHSGTSRKGYRRCTQELG
uniref:Uncharacterized protein n=1 Tax=Aegilops tauschii TaxID=37682 RepID=R7W2H8_AEGTA